MSNNYTIKELAILDIISYEKSLEDEIRCIEEKSNEIGLEIKSFSILSRFITFEKCVCHFELNVLGTKWDYTVLEKMTPTRPLKTLIESNKRLKILKYIKQYEKLNQ